MKTLPNGVQIFNATPHGITFWESDWDAPISVGPDKLINAKAVERKVSENGVVQMVSTVFEGTAEGQEIIDAVKQECPNALIVGSIIAAQAYPGDVVSMVAHPDYLRVPPSEKKMLPDKFNIFQ